MAGAGDADAAQDAAVVVDGAAAVEAVAGGLARTAEAGDGGGDGAVVEDVWGAGDAAVEGPV